MLLSEYVQQCVIGDIMLTHKYSMAELMQSSDPYEIIFRKPSPLRGVIVPRGNSPHRRDSRPARRWPIMC